MKAEEREKLWSLYDIVNKMGGSADYTAVSPIALMKYKGAHGKVSRVISLIITGEDDARCKQLMNELDALSRWNFGDRYGNLSADEQKVNEKIKQVMNGWTPFNDI